MPDAGPVVLTTVRGPGDEYWERRTEYVEPPTRSRTFSWVASTAWRARGHGAVVLRGTTGSADLYRDLLLAAAIRLLAPRTAVVVSDATLDPGSRALSARSRALGALAPALARGLVRLADSPRVTWCVLSRAEVATFARTWGVAPDRVAFTPFKHTLFRGEADREPSTGDYLFSGGNSLRDHAMLVEAARGLGTDVVVASRWRPDGELPAGIEVRETSHEEFVALMAGSRAVVLCLRPSVRSTGQQTYLNAMALGKAVVVTDVAGVRDHIEDGVTGVVVEPSAAAVRSALRDVTDPARRGFYEAMGRRARERVLSTLTDRQYHVRLLALADTPARDRAAGRPRGNRHRPVPSSR